MILQTKRLNIREYTPDDFDALYEILSDEETMKYYPKPYDENGMTRIKAYEKGDEALYVYRITRGEWKRSRNKNDRVFGNRSPHSSSLVRG